MSDIGTSSRQLFITAVRSRLAVAMAMVVTLALGVLAPEASARQSAPAGNSHPQSEMLNARGQSNPFGEPGAMGDHSTPSTDPQRKHEFSRSVNTAALRDVAVYHSGRVKILDSLARETVSELLHRKDYRDIVYKDGSRSPTKYTYDPLFTFLDLAIDPAYYQDKAIIGVTYLPLRDAILERVFPLPANASAAERAAIEEQRESWKRVGRLTPKWIARWLDEVQKANKPTQPLQASLNDAHEAIAMYLGLAGTLAVVPPAPETPGQAWRMVGELPEGSAVRAAFAEMGRAWRAMDADAVNSQIEIIRAELPRIRPEVYPGVRRDVERVYNASKPFEYGAWAYAVSFLLLTLAMTTGRRWLSRAGLTVLGVAVLIHALGFAARCYIAERYSIQNQFESMTGVSLFAAAVGIWLMAWKRSTVFAAAAAGAGFLVLIFATQTAIPGKEINREAAILNTSVLLKYHVTIVLVSYGLITLGMIMSLFYLARYYGASRVGDENEAALKELDSAHNVVLQLAFWTLGVGILLGAWWADHSWGRWWAFDPKELWALVTWIVYLIVVHVRVAGVRNRGLVTAWLSVLGFVAMVWCYFGVNLLLPGLHAYA